jgi:hypothetical protein
MFNRSAIAKEAHRVARIFAAGSMPYRPALSLGFKQAWRHGKGILEIERRDAAMPPAERARRDEAIFIQCNTNRLTAGDYARLNELARARPEQASRAVGGTVRPTRIT